MRRREPKLRAAAIRFMVWRECEEHGWDRSIPEVARAIDETPSAVARSVALAQWQSRFRATVKRELRPVTPEAIDRIISGPA